MNKSFWIILGVAILGLVGIFMLSGGKASDTSSGEFAYSEPLTDPQPHDHSIGEGTKGTIVEYADFQCPFCGTYFPLLQQVKQQYGDEVKIIFRNYPIVSSHPQAMSAHRAAGAAAKQGKFWEMHDRIFADQTLWSGNNSAASMFEGYARELGLNMDQYNADEVSESVAAKISADQQSATTLEVNSTPTIFYNGQKLDPLPTTIEEWDKLINPESTE